VYIGTPYESAITEFFLCALIKMATSTSSLSPSAAAAAGETLIKVMASDDRVDPRIVAFLSPYGLANRVPDTPVDAATGSLENMYEFNRLRELRTQAAYKSMNPEVIDKDKVTVSSVTIKGADNNDVLLYVHTPNDKPANIKIPCVYHIHGGGMLILTAADNAHRNWRNMIASRGYICVGVEFRNSAGVLGSHPFPAGLNDCHSGLEWLYSQKDALGVSKIVLAGESGGANLSFALSIKCKREGTVNRFDGVFGQCPFVSGIYGCSIEEQLARFPSLVEFDGYILTTKGMAISVVLYTPDDRNAFRHNPLAWPIAATTEDLHGLPPHMIIVNDRDPLRDEGLEYFRKLLAAGVIVSSIKLNGTVHCSEVNLVNAIPNITSACIDQMVSFVNSL
jgi:acetyl esterase